MCQVTCAGPFLSCTARQRPGDAAGSATSARPSGKDAIWAEPLWPSGTEPAPSWRVSQAVAFSKCFCKGTFSSLVVKTCQRREEKRPTPKHRKFRPSPTPGSEGPSPTPGSSGRAPRCRDPALRGPRVALGSPLVPSPEPVCPPCGSEHTQAALPPPVARPALFWQRPQCCDRRRRAPRPVGPRAEPGGPGGRRFGPAAPAGRGQSSGTLCPSRRVTRGWSPRASLPRETEPSRPPPRSRPPEGERTRLPGPCVPRGDHRRGRAGSHGDARPRAAVNAHAFCDE